VTKTNLKQTKENRQMEKSKRFGVSRIICADDKETTVYFLL